MTDQLAELTDEQIRGYLENYKFICPGDEIVVYLKFDVPDFGRKVEGMLFSVHPVFQVMQGDIPVSINPEIIALKVPVKCSVAKRLEQLKVLREQARKCDMLGVVARGNYLVKLDAPEERPDGMEVG